jgi:hypothetical protein
MRRSLGSASLLCSLGLAALVCACGGSARAPVSPAPPAYRGEKPVLLTAGALAMLPADTWLVLAGASPRALAAELRWPEALHPGLRARLSAGVSAVMDADVVDPDNLDEIGLDPDGAFGLALFGGDRNTAMAVFARVSERGRLQAFLDRVLAPALGGLEARAVGQATVLYPARAQEIALVLRDDVVLVLVVEVAQDRESLVDALATRDRAQSLAADPGLLASMKRLDFGAEVAGYLAMHHLGDRVLREIDRGVEGMRRQLEEIIAATEAEIAAGRDAGALRAQVAQQQQWMDELERYAVGTRGLFEQVVQPLGGIGLGASFSGPDLRVRVDLQPRAGSLPARLLRHGGRPLGLLSALEQAPVFALGGYAEPEALLELARIATQVTGGDLESSRAAIRMMTGVDLVQDVLPLLDGEIAVAITADRERLLAGGSSPDRVIALSAVVGLRDPAAARALLDRASTQGPLAAMGADRPGGRGLKVSGWDERPFYVDVAGSYLVVSMDGEAAARLVAGSPASLADRLAGEAQALLRAQPWDGLFLLNVADMLAMTWSSVPDEPPAAEASASEQDPEKAALQRELAAIDAELTPLENEVDAAIRQGVLATSRSMGNLLLVAHAGEGGVTLVGGVLTSAAHAGEAVLDWVMGVFAAANGWEPDAGLAAKKQRMDELQQRRWAIVLQLAGIQQEQVE